YGLELQAHITRSIAVTVTKPNRDGLFKMPRPLLAASHHLSFTSGLELHHHSKPQGRFIFPQVRTETCGSRHTGKTGSSRQEWARYKRSACHWGPGIEIGDYAGKKIDARRDPTTSRPVRYVRMTISKLSAERDVLLGHPVERE